MYCTCSVNVKLKGICVLSSCAAAALLAELFNVLPGQSQYVKYATVSGPWHLQANLGFKGADALREVLVFCKAFLHGIASDLSVLLEQHHSFIKSELLHCILQEVIVP